MSAWMDTRVAADRTHHLRAGAPLYPARFLDVLSFHAPGLAAVRDETGAFHIDVTGQPVYARRFSRTFGFYEDRATVEQGGEAFHLRVDGSELSAERYAWCGNFQSGRCTVRDQEGLYFHVDQEGRPVYARRYAYAGDFRDGLAVVQEADGSHLHIHDDGRPLNGRRFLDLDVFHKGHARARDERGWHHVDTSGEPLYGWRFAMVEPFYNGQARVEREDGALLVVDERGEILRELRPPRRSELQTLSGEMVGFWKTQALRTAVELRLVEALPSTVVELARRLALIPDRCERLLRALGELGLVLLEDGTWRVTPRGALLHRKHPLQMADAALHWGRDCYRLWEELPDALRLPGTWRPPSFFETLSHDAQHVASYHRAMSSYALQDYARLPDILGPLSSGTVLDVGGGTGTLLMHLLRQRPGLQGVLLERAEVLQCMTVPAGLASRLRLVPGDFFSPWDVQAHVIFLARVLHDWEDPEATRILERARAALLPSGRLHVIEFVLDEERTEGALLDLHMLVTTGGRERTEQRFRELFSHAGLRLCSSQRLDHGNVLLTGEPF